MTTIRNPHREKYTVVGRELINDPQISFRAKGILIWLLDKPDGWIFDSMQLSREFKEGRDAVRSALKELSVAGYLSRSKIRDEKGRWITITELRESPGQSSAWISDAWVSDVRVPDVGEPGVITNTETITDNEQKKTSSSSRAQALAKTYYDGRAAKNDKPNQPFPSIIAVLKRALNNGWSEEELAAFLETTRVVTGGALDLWRGKHPLPKPPDPRAAIWKEFKLWIFRDSKDGDVWLHGVGTDWVEQQIDQMWTAGLTHETIIHELKALVPQ